MQQVEGFLSHRRLALVGASRAGKGFGNTVLRDLRQKGYDVIPVHPGADVVDGVECVSSIADLPAGVEACVLVVPPPLTERLVEEAAEHGIGWIWMQQGAESAEAVRRAEAAGIEAVHGHCILMFASPTGLVHRVHHWLWAVLGRLPGDGPSPSEES